jgi:hypothetical protein
MICFHFIAIIKIKFPTLVRVEIIGKRQSPRQPARATKWAANVPQSKASGFILLQSGTAQHGQSRAIKK